MPLFKNRLIPYFKLKLDYLIKDFLILWTFIAISVKSIIFLGFISNSNPSNINLAGGFSKVYYPLYFCCFILILLSFCFVFKGRARAWFLFILNVSISTLFLFDLWYFRAFNSFVSPYLISQAANLNNLSDSIISMMSPWDCVLFIDIIAYLIIMIKLKNLYTDRKRHLIFFTVLFILSTGYTLYQPFMAAFMGNSNSSSIYGVTWRPDITLYRLSPIGYHFFDTFTYFNDSRKLSLKQDDINEIKAWYRDKTEKLPDNKYKGIFKGKNLIFVQVESLENFVIGQKTVNQEITPNINKLLKNSLYFSRIEEQVNLGTSSDSDFMVNTSLYPVRRGSTFFRYPNNKYNSLPKLMEKSGYSTLAIHPDNGSYWNWMTALKSIGFQNCIDASHFKMDEIIGLGLSDESYLRQVKPIILKQKQPFYVFMITLSNHSPFNLPVHKQNLQVPANIANTKLDGYFQSVHYTDKHLGNFISALDKEGLLENTVVAISGDHCGVHKFYSADVAKIKPREEWWADNYNNIPLIIYQKNLNGEKFGTEGGQIDTMPTLLYLMGVDEKDYIDSAMGRNLLKTQKNFAVLPNGTYRGLSSGIKEKDETVKGLNIADIMIRSNYFEDYKN